MKQKYMRLHIKQVIGLNYMYKHIEMYFIAAKIRWHSGSSVLFFVNYGILLVLFFINFTCLLIWILYFFHLIDLNCLIKMYTQRKIDAESLAQHLKNYISIFFRQLNKNVGVKNWSFNYFLSFRPILSWLNKWTKYFYSIFLK